MRKKYLLPAAILSVLLVAAGALAAAGWQEAAERKMRLREIYEGAVLSALRQTEDMRLCLQKAVLSQDRETSAAYLSQVSSGGAQVQRSLSLLPLAHTANQRAMKFANQLADYADSLIRKGEITSQDYRQLGQLIEGCQAYTQALSAAREELSAGALAGEGLFPAGEEAPGYDSAVSYPTLIYDGPFSDARERPGAGALAELKEISREEALSLAAGFAGRERVVSAIPGTDSGGDIPCYGVTLRLSDVTLEAAVTRQGGKILWMAPDSADFSQQKGLEECRAAAEQFLSRQGYGQMEPTFFQAYQGVGVISFAAVQGDILLYPDLIKVQLRLDNAQVVGWEARNYLLNHRERGALEPALTPEEARAKISSRLDIRKNRLCVIPTEQGERLCYEFRGVFQGDTYLVYIDAETGEQAELLKLVEGEAGLEAV